jgi:hypothetical protein
MNKAGLWPTGHSRAPSIIATTTPRVAAERSKKYCTIETQRSRWPQPKRGAIHAQCQGVRQKRVRRRGPGNGCASIGPRHRKAKTSAQMQQGDARRTRRWEQGRGSACDSMPATRDRRYRMRDRRSWSCTEASACSACIASLHLRWILFCAAAPQSRDAPLPAGCRKFVARCSDFEG